MSPRKEYPRGPPTDAARAGSSRTVSCGCVVAATAPAARILAGKSHPHSITRMETPTGRKYRTRTRGTPTAGDHQLRATFRLSACTSVPTPHDQLPVVGKQRVVAYSICARRAGRLTGCRNGRRAGSRPRTRRAGCADGRRRARTHTPRHTIRVRHNERARLGRRAHTVKKQL